MAWDSQTAKNWWSGESEAFARVMDAMEKGTAVLKQTVIGDYENEPIIGLALIAPNGTPGYDRLILTPTGQDNVYQFSTPNQVAGGNISGVIAADPSTGKYLPVQDYTKQIQYTPGSPGGWARNTLGTLADMYKELGPIATVLANAALPGLGTALSTVAAIDEGNAENALKSLALSTALNQTGLSQKISETAGSDIAGKLGSSTVAGLLSGQDLSQALTNAAISTGVNQAAGQISGQTPAEFEKDVNQVLDSIAGTPVSQLETDINQILDMPVSTPPPEQIMVTETQSDLTPAPMLDEIVTQLEAGSLGSESDLPAPVPAPAPEPLSGQDLAADSIPGNTLKDVANVLDTTPTMTKDQVEQMIKVALTGLTASEVANQLAKDETKTPGFDIVPVQTDWKSPVYDQSFTPIDLESIFQNLQSAQWQPRRDITGGAYMGSPVNISDIVNKIMGAESTPQALPANIANVVGGILGPTAIS